MIYDFIILVKDGKETRQKQFYLSAKDKKEFYHRVASQYGVLKDDVIINREIEEDEIDINQRNTLQSSNTRTIKTNKNGETEVVSNNPTDYLEKARALIQGNIYSMNDNELTDKLNHGWKVLRPTSIENELSELIMKYDQVKLYYKAGTSKEKQYLILYK